MMFARAIGDPNRIYYDHEYAAQTQIGHVIAPPTFTSASAQFDSDYPLRPTIGKAWIGSGREPSGIEAQTTGAMNGGYLHAEQHFEYHRPLKPGDVLSRTSQAGASWVREGRRGGTLHFQESITEFRDEEGQLVVTSRSIRVRTSQTVGIAT
jgi:acyl dehydratase